MDSEFARQYYESAAQGHWWMTGRAKLVAGLTARVGLSEGRVVDLGAGAVSLFPPVFEVVKVDLVIPQDVAGHFVKASAASLPFNAATFAAVGLFDVIEHIEHPGSVLEEARRVLQPKGALFYTLPAHQSLWSEHDVLVGHMRRYELEEIRAILEESGYRPVYSTMFYGFLLLPAFLRKLANSSSSLTMPPRPINRALSKVAMRSARSALKSVHRPGLSIAGVAVAA